MLEEIIATIGSALDKAAVPYMVIGGQAVLLYGEPRLTKVIDITLGVDVGRLSDIVNLVEKIGGRPLPDNLEAFVNKTFVLPVLIGNIRLDFIFSLSDYEKQAIKRGRKVKIKKRFNKLLFEGGCYYSYNICRQTA